jgi:hypothetical protein
MHMVVADLVVASCVVFLVAQQHLQLLEAITCMRMSKKRYCWKLLLARNIFIKNALLKRGRFYLPQRVK